MEDLTDMRISETSTPVVRRGEGFEVEIDGTLRQAFEGETVASVMLANGERTLRNTRKAHDPRGIFCGIGVCYDCLVVVDGRSNVRACMTRAVSGMKVQTQEGIGGGVEG